VSDVLCYDAYDGALFCPLSFGPGRRQDIGDLVVGHVGQTTQHVAKVSQRIYVNSFLKRILQQEGDRTGIAGGYFRIESSTPNFFTKPVLESARAYCVNPFLKTKVAAPCSSVQLHAVTRSSRCSPPPFAKNPVLPSLPCAPANHQQSTLVPPHSTLVMKSSANSSQIHRAPGPGLQPASDRLATNYCPKLQNFAVGSFWFLPVPRTTDPYRFHTDFIPISYRF
jgi:hypothetical protein